MTGTSVTDCFTLPKFGRVDPTMPQKWSPMDRVEVDTYDNGHHLIWLTLYIQKKKVKQIRPK